MPTRTCTIKGPDKPVEIGPTSPPVIIAGPCVLEDPGMEKRIAQSLKQACAEYGLQFIFKASFDKANRTSVSSPRGPGLNDGLQRLRAVRDSLGIPVTTDIHEPAQAEIVARSVDMLQIPAFLCRQTDLLIAAGNAAAASGCAVNIKKGQFVSPAEMVGPVDKVESTGCRNIVLTERGTFFGYHRLVNDFIGVGDLMELRGVTGANPPVCFDCTHSAQLPGASSTTGGRRERVPLLAKAAMAAGVHAIFLECHPEPEKARSDASTMLPLDSVPGLLRTLSQIWRACR